ncbi:hypothetical protein [Hanstruepera ponticola]|uniref:hypothetical protein n=1 Tax=Hanstruepera ponticola TaxID=2042995 RepID=UPI000CF17234|nr:hypothetical protein [Hanstruepera ponticola]
MNKLQEILYRFKILNLSNRKIDYWIKTKQFDKIIYASKNGNYKIRIKILDGIKDILELEPILNIASDLIDDNVKIVSEKAIELLKSKPDYSKRISAKETFWKEQNKKRIGQNITSSKNDQTWKSNKKGMVRLNQVKQQLKKSMYGEKWM